MTISDGVEPVTTPTTDGSTTTPADPTTDGGHPKPADPPTT